MKTSDVIMTVAVVLLVGGIAVFAGGSPLYGLLGGGWALWSCTRK